MRNKLYQIVMHYGLKSQVKKFSEEAYELIEALHFHLNTNDQYEEDAYDLIVEEIADVEVLIGQFCEYFGINTDEIQNIMEMKTNRQIKRIDNEKRSTLE